MPSGGFGLDATSGAEAQARQVSFSRHRAGIYPLLYRVTDSAGLAATAEFRIVINGGPVFATVQTNRTFRAAHSADTESQNLTLVAAAGSGVFTYALSGINGEAVINHIPGGAFDPRPGQRVMSFSRRQTGTFGFRYTVTNAAGLSRAVTFNITIIGGPEFASAPPNLTYSVADRNQSVQLPGGSNSTGPYRYALTGLAGEPLEDVLPRGTFNAQVDSRRLTFSRATAGIYPVLYAVTDNSQYRHVSTARFNIVIVGGPKFTIIQTDRTFSASNTPGSISLPQANGEALITYAVSGELGEVVGDSIPGGSFDSNPQRRRLHFSRQRGGVFPFLYTATDRHGLSVATRFNVVIAGGPIFASAQSDRTYRTNSARRILDLPSATGNGAITYTLRGERGEALADAIPGGVFRRLNGGSFLSFFRHRAGIYPLRYIATDSSDFSSTLRFTITIEGPLSMSAVPTDRTYRAETNRRHNFQLPFGNGSSRFYPFSYALTGPDNAAVVDSLPNGSFDASPNERRVSFAASTVGVYPLTYVVTSDGTGDIRETKFNVVITGPAFTGSGFPLAEQTYVGQSAIAPLTLPAAADGAQPLGYTLTGADNQALAEAVPGLVFEAASRVLSGTPSTSGSVALTYRAVDFHGNAIAVFFTVEVEGGPTFDATPPDLTYSTAAASLTTQLPAASGIGVITYAVTGADALALGDSIPDGVFDASPAARNLSFGGRRAGVFPMRYTATDANGVSVTASFNITLDFDPTFAAQQPDRTYPGLNSERTLRLPAAVGSGAITYALTGGPGETLADTITDGAFDARAGRRLLTFSRRLPGVYPLRYIATDSSGSSRLMRFNIVITGPIFDSLALPDLTYPAGAAIDAVTLPQASRQGEVTYALVRRGGTAVHNAVPGMAFDAATRVLSGTPTTAASGTAMRYTVSNVDGAATNPFNLTVTGPMLPPAVLVMNGVPSTGTRFWAHSGTDVNIRTLPLAVSSAPPLTYSLWGPNEQPVGEAIPNLTFDADIRRFSGTPLKSGPYVRLTYRVVDRYANRAQRTDAFYLQIRGGPTFTNPPSRRAYNASTSATPQVLLLSAATGGIAPYTYTVTGRSGQAVADVIPGGAFASTSSARRLSFLRTQQGSFPLAYTVTDSRGVYFTVNFTIVIGDDNLNLSQVVNRTVAVEQDRTFTLPNGIGDTPAASYTYTLRGAGGEDLATALPDAQVAFDAAANRRRLTLTPTRSGVYPLAYRVAIGNGLFAESTFNVTVPTPSFATIASVYSYDISAAVALTLPPGDGTLSYTYTLTGPTGQAVGDVLPGLSFNATSRILRGQATQASTAMLTYRVADRHANSGAAIFSVQISGGPSFAANPPRSGTLMASAAGLHSRALPFAAGGVAPLTYSVTGRAGQALSEVLLDGVFEEDASGNTLKFSRNRMGRFLLRYSVQDAEGNADSADFNLLITLSPGLLPEDVQNQPDLSVAIEQNVDHALAHGGYAVSHYTLSGANGEDLADVLPWAVNFVGDSERRLRFTPTTSGVFPLRYRAVTSTGIYAEGFFSLTVRPPSLAAPENVRYTFGQTVSAHPAGGGRGSAVYLHPNRGASGGTGDRVAGAVLRCGYSRVERRAHAKRHRAAHLWRGR